jgi:hypothetical protein
MYWGIIDCKMMVRLIYILSIDESELYVDGCNFKYFKVGKLMNW